MEEIVDIFDKSENPTGLTIEKQIAHEKGLLHRVVHVHFYDDAWNVYLQKRSQNKEHFPWMLHFAIGWHISAWEDVLDALVREWKEEIWYTILPEKLALIGIFHHQSWHSEYGLLDNEIAFDYAYRFNWNIDQFVFEDWEVEDMCSMHIHDLIKIPASRYKEKNIVPYIHYPEIFQWIQNVI